MFLESSQTTINSGTHDANIQHTLREHLVRTLNGGETQFITLQEGVMEGLTVYGLGEGQLINVKPFFNPIQFDHDDKEYIVVDMRTSTRWDRQLNRPVIANQSLFRRDMIRTLLESVWLGSGPNDILNLGHYQIQVFAAWVSEMFAKRFALDAEQQVRISVLSAFYYLCLFVNEGDADLRRFIPIISKVTMTSTPFVMDTLNGIDFIFDLESFLAQIQEKLQTDRLEGVGIDVMITMLAGSWFGPNHAMLVGIALEYPPTWNALLYLSLTDRATRASGIAKVALRRERDALAREYVSITSRLLMQQSTLDPLDARGAK